MNQLHILRLSAHKILHRISAYKISKLLLATYTMPITKTQKKREPLWKEWDRLAQKKGVHHAVLTTTGDTYTGDWYDNKKNGIVTFLPWTISSYHALLLGKGNQVWRKTGAVYDGDWKDDRRHGYGVYSVMKKETLVKEYAGGWKNDKKHVS